MGKYINFGKFNKNYIYVILTGVFYILNYHFPTVLTEIFLYSEKIDENSKYLFKHDHTMDNFRFFGLLIFSFIYYIYEKKSFKRKINTDQSNNSIFNRGCFETIKNNNERKKNINKKKYNLNIIITLAIFAIINILTGIVSSLSIFSLWMVILLIIFYTNTKLLKRETYNHQKLAIYFSFISAFLFQLSSFILTLKSEEKNDNNLYKDYLSLWFLPLGLIIFFLFECITAYTYSKIKWFMDLKWISLTRLFIVYSILGFFINIIFCIILSFIKCEGKVANYFCKIIDNKGDKYLDNIFIFFDNISKIYEKNQNYLIYIYNICRCDIRFLVYFFPFINFKKFRSGILIFCWFYRRNI